LYINPLTFENGVLVTYEELNYERRDGKKERHYEMCEVSVRQPLHWRPVSVSLFHDRRCPDRN